MTQGSPTTGELVARLRAHGAESWAALMDEAADRLEAITTLERELEEARAKAASWEKIACDQGDEFNDMQARAERAETDSTASQAEVERLREALKPFTFDGMEWRHGSSVQIVIALADIYRARAAIQVEESKP